jgi:hypothetical protein
MPSFRAECDEFWELKSQGRQNETDPAWVGVFCAVRPGASAVKGHLDAAAQTLCVALNTRGTESSLGTLEGQALADYPGIFFELSLTALRAAQWSAKPQVRCVRGQSLHTQFADHVHRVIQTCLLWGPFLCAPM